MKFVGRHGGFVGAGEERIKLRSEAIRHLALKAPNGVAEGVFRTFQTVIVTVVIAKYRSQVPNELSETNDRSCRHVCICGVPRHITRCQRLETPETLTPCALLTVGQAGAGVISRRKSRGPLRPW